MSVKKFLHEIKQELQSYHALREKIIYPEGWINSTTNDKNDDK